MDPRMISLATAKFIQIIMLANGKLIIPNISMIVSSSENIDPSCFEKKIIISAPQTRRQAIMLSPVLVLFFAS
jgi:hypothetical protein